MSKKKKDNIVTLADFRPKPEEPPTEPTSVCIIEIWSDGRTTSDWDTDVDYRWLYMHIVDAMSSIMKRDRKLNGYDPEVDLETDLDDETE